MGWIGLHSFRKYCKTGFECNRALWKNTCFLRKGGLFMQDKPFWEESYSDFEVSAFSKGPTVDVEEQYNECRSELSVGKSKIAL